MRLTQFTDYALRLLIWLAGHEPSCRITIGDSAAVLGIPLNHLTKIAHRLARETLLTSSRGRSGGLSLARSPREITVGQIIRVTEPDFKLVACMSGQACTLSERCNLMPFLDDALAAFLRVMDGITLFDIVTSAKNSSAQTANAE